MRAVNDFAIAGVLPDRTGAARAPARADARERRAGLPDDRIEAEAADFHELVAQGYRELMAAEPERIVRVAADGDPELVAERVREALGGD